MPPKQPTSTQIPSTGIEWSRVLGHDYGEDFARSLQPPTLPSHQHAEMCEFELSEMNKLARARATPRTQKRAKEAYWEFLDCMAKGMNPSRYKSVFSQCMSPTGEQVEKCRELKMDLRFEVLETMRKETSDATGKLSRAEKAALKSCRGIGEEAQRISEFYEPDDPKTEQAQQRLMDCLVSRLCPNQVKFLQECLQSNSKSYGQCINQSKEVVRCFTLVNRKLNNESGSGIGSNFGGDDDDDDDDDDDYY